MSNNKYIEQVEKKNIIPQTILSYQIQSYNFDKYLSKKKLYPKNLLISRKNNKINFNSINYNSNLVKSINFTKDLISEPANTLNKYSRFKNKNFKT